MSIDNNTPPTGRYSARMRRFVLLQAALQVSVALTPAWAITAVAQQTPAPSALHDYLNPAAQLAQSGNFNGFAAQQASGMATQQLQQWLQNFGTARVELGINSQFSTQTGSVDLLLPLYDSPDRLFFTQNGIRLKDGQTTGNFGLGQRHFIDDWMVGYNAFYDENFSEGHKRFGIGLETWRDYLKLSANGYLRISDWKNAGDLAGYQARPASGFDLRAEGWLADYPSLSARLMYEQYYGSEVALFGKEKRQKNPMAMTAGLSWTPVPLFSLSADHKAGGNQNESLFGLQMNWQFGRSLASQLDPDQVGLGATLSGNGMDLVNRNNNIVLEYRKQELVKLGLSAIEGVGTSIKPIDYQLESQYGLKEIIWNDAAIVQAGGRIGYQGNGQYTVTLPPFILGGSNSYTLSGVAVDQRNNRSSTATTTITVGRTDVSAMNSRVEADDRTLAADGKSTTRIVIHLRDKDNLPMEGALQRLKVAVHEDDLPETGQVSTAQSTASPGAKRYASLGDITEQGRGLYEVTLTTGTRSSLAVVTTSLDDVRLPLASVKQLADEASAGLNEGELTLLNTGPIPANGTNLVQASARVLDGNNNLVPGVDVTFMLDGSARPVGGALVVKTDSKGIALLSFTNTVAETVKVSAKVGSGMPQSAEATFIADVTTADIVASSVMTDVTEITADSSSSVLYTVTVKDASGNPVPNLDLDWSNNPDGTTLTGQTRTNGEGKATVRMHTRKRGEAVLQVSVNGKNKVAAPNVTMTPFHAAYSHPMTVEKMYAILEKSHDFYFNPHPVGHGGSFVFPAASESNKGAKVLIDNRNWAQGSSVTINGVITNLFNTTGSYESFGDKWIRTN